MNARRTGPAAADASPGECPAGGGAAPGQDLLLHVLGHPDLPLDVAASPGDAQVQTCHHFCLMLARAQVRFMYYGMSGSVVPGGQVVDLGQGIMPWEFGNPWHREYSARLSRSLREQIRRQGSCRQLVCSLYGAAHSEVDVGDVPVIEPMVGYDHCWAPYRVFPSYAHQHVIYTAQSEYVRDTRWFDTVIPHFVDAQAYPLVEAPADYVLFLGRDAPDKGVALAEEVCAVAGVPLKKVHGGCWGARKARLLGQARAVLMPTLYLEPFGYVSIEAQMCGVPVVSTDWGAFAETVLPGVSGFRCRTQAEFLRALELVDGLDRQTIRRRALRTYSIEAVTADYLDYFDFVWNVHTKGGYYAPDALRHGFRRSPGMDPFNIERRE